MSSARKTVPHNQHGSGLEQYRRISLVSNVEVPQIVVYTRSHPSRSQGLESPSSSTLSHLDSRYTSRQVPTPSGTSHSTFASNYSGYLQTYGPLNPDSSQQSRSSSHGVDLETLSQYDANLYQASQQSVIGTPVTLEDENQLPSYAPTIDITHHWLNEDASNLPNQAVMSPNQSWLTPSIDLQVPQYQVQLPRDNHLVNCSDIGYGPNMEENLFPNDQLQLPSDVTYALRCDALDAEGPPWTPYSSRTANQHTSNNPLSTLGQGWAPQAAGPDNQHELYFSGFDNTGQYLQDTVTEMVEVPPSGDPIGPPMHFGPCDGQQVDNEGRMGNRKVGRRRGPLSAGSRENAQERRKNPGCFRCRIFKKQV